MFIRSLISSVIVVAAMAFSTAYCAQAVTTAKPQTAAAAKELKRGASEVAIYIGDMHCNNCAKKIAAKLYRVKGVVKVRTSVKENLAVITPQAKKQIDANAAWAAVTKAGFEPTKLVGPQGTFVPNEKTKQPEKVAEAETPTRS